MASRRKPKAAPTEPPTALPVTDPADQDEACRLLADCFSVFAHPVRMQLFCRLRGGRATVSDLARNVGITVQNASQQLRIMREKGVLVAQREGQSVYLSIADPRIVQAANLLRDVWTAQIQRQASAMVSPLFADERPDAEQATPTMGE